MQLLWLLGLICLALFAGITWYLRPLKPSIFKLQFCYTRRAFLAVLVAWQSVGVARFRKHLVIDYIYLVCYGLLGYLLSTRVTWLVEAPQPLQAVLPWLLPAAAALDAVENRLHHYLVRGQQAMHAPSMVFPLAGGVSTLKWVLIVCFGVLVLYAFCVSRIAGG